MARNIDDVLGAIDRAKAQQPQQKISPEFNQAAQGQQPASAPAKAPDGPNGPNEPGKPVASPNEPKGPGPITPEFNKAAADIDRGSDMVKKDSSTPDLKPKGEIRQAVDRSAHNEKLAADKARMEAINKMKGPSTDRGPERGPDGPSR